MCEITALEPGIERKSENVARPISSNQTNLGNLQSKHAQIPQLANKPGPSSMSSSRNSVNDNQDAGQQIENQIRRLDISSHSAIPASSFVGQLSCMNFS